MCRGQEKEESNAASESNVFDRDAVGSGGVLCWGQSTYGVILGTVKDSSGASVANATVKITNTDENTVREATTSQNGDYEAQNLLPAHYSVTVSNQGFATFTATNLTLAARQTLRVDALLQVGQMTQSVVVESSKPALSPLILRPSKPLSIPGHC